MAAPHFLRLFLLQVLKLVLQFPNALGFSVLCRQKAIERRDGRSRPHRIVGIVRMISEQVGHRGVHLLHRHRAPRYLAEELEAASEVMLAVPILEEHRERN